MSLALLARSNFFRRDNFQCKFLFFLHSSFRSLLLRSLLLQLIFLSAPKDSLTLLAALPKQLLIDQATAFCFWLQMSNGLDAKKSIDKKPMEAKEARKKDTRQTSPYLRRFERAEIIGRRAKEISDNEGAPIQIDLTKMVLTDPIEIAKEEMRQKKFPLQVVRVMPSGSMEKWNLDELIQLED